jgi:hypothetical protein
MKRLPIMLLVCMWTLMPTAASADNGGWLDWLYGLDMKLVGIGTDFHLLCVNKDNQKVRCEEWFLIPRLITGQSKPPIDFDNLRHQIDFRVAFYWKYGERFSDVVDQRSVKAFKLMGMYYYHFRRAWQFGGGAGYMPFFGDGFDLFSRGIVTPVSVVWAPFPRGGTLARSFYVRVEESYIMQGFSGANFGNSATRFSTNGEWNPSFAIGFDFRRR